MNHHINNMDIPPKERNNRFPQAQKSFNDAGNDLQELGNYGVLGRRHLSHLIKENLCKKKQELSQVLETGEEELNYSKELLHDSKELLKHTRMLVRHLIKGGGYSLYSASDYVDTQISKTEFLRKKENSKLWNKIKQGVRNNVVKLLIGTTLIGGGTYTALKTPTAFEKHHMPFWDNNPDFFDTTLINKQLPKDTLAPGIIIIRDARIIFYVLQREDCKTEYLTDMKIFRKNLAEKLAKIPEFAYLLDLPTEKTKSFNLSKNAIENNENFIKNGSFYVPIPLNPRDREISPEDFTNYVYEAIQEMKTGPYQQEMNILLQTVNEQELITTILAFARSETSEEYALFSQPIGSVELHRREEKYQAYSFSYFHILMEKGKDDREGPGLRARKKLGFTEGQCYHPKNATKLFLGYWFEKVKEVGIKYDTNKDGQIDIRDFFPLTSKNIEKVGEVFNGGNGYSKKLSKNYEYIKNVMENSHH